MKKIDNRQAVLQEIKHQLRQYYPRLHLYNEQGFDVVRGTFPVRLRGEVIDCYLVEILIPEQYPHAIPLIRELGGRIPIDIDRHVSIGNYGNFLCLFFRDERWKYWPEGTSFLDFLDNPLNDYFLGQIYYELNKRFPFGERGHGVKAVIEYYSEELGSKNLFLIFRFLQYLSRPMKRGRYIVKGHWPCYCGSGKRLRDCHYAKLIDLRSKISWEAALMSSQQLVAYLVRVMNLTSQGRVKTPVD